MLRSIIRECLFFVLNVWILCAARDLTARGGAAGLRSGNLNRFTDIRDGLTDPMRTRAVAPVFHSPVAEVFPDLQPTHVLPDLWSRAMLDAVKSVTRDLPWLELPADLRLGRRTLPWTHSLVAPLVRVSQALDRDASLGDWIAGGRAISAPRRLVLSAAWQPPTPVWEWSEIVFAPRHRVWGLTDAVGLALAALNPHGVSLMRLNEVTEQPLSFDGRGDDPDWAAEALAKRGALKRPIFAAEAEGQAMDIALRWGLMLSNGGRLRRGEDSVEILCPDGRVRSIDHAEASRLVTERAAELAGVPQFHGCSSVYPVILHHLRREVLNHR